MGKEEKGKVVRAGIGYTVGNYMLKGLSFITVPIFSRLLSTSDYGIFNAYLAYQSIAFLLVGMALHTSLKNAKYRYENDFGRYNSCCILMMLLNLAAWVVIGNLIYPLYADTIGFSRLIVNLLLIDSFGTALIQFYNVYVGIDYKYGDFLKLSAFNAVGNLVCSVVLILTVFRDRRAEGRIIGNVIPVFLIAVFIILSFWRKQKPRFKAEYAGFALRYSLPLIPHGISQVILAQFDRLMIKGMIGESESGIYSFAYNIFSIINVTSNSLDNVWGPWFYERMEEKDYDAIRRQSAKYAFGMMLFSVMVMLATPELVMILGTPAYHDAMYSVIPIVIGGYFVFLYSLPASVEYYHAKTGFIAMGTAAAAAVNVILNYFFIQKYGYIAAAYTTLITYFLYFIFHYILAWRIQKAVLFHTGKIFFDIVFILITGIVSLMLTEYWLVRWGLIIVVGIYGIFWLDKEFDVRQKIREKAGRS
jgi:O-antigen/teichoic acid export membrane protein